MFSPLAQNPVETLDLNALDQLIKKALQAKQEAEQQKAIYDSLRDQICATLQAIGEDKFESFSGKVRLKSTKSKWVYSDKTQAIAEQLKTMQDLEKRKGIAVAQSATISADVFPV